MGQTTTTSPVIAPAQHRPAPTTPMATQPVPPPRTTYKLAPHIRNAPSPAHTVTYTGITQQVSIGGNMGLSALLVLSTICLLGKSPSALM